MRVFRNRWGDVFFGSGEETSTAVFSKEFASGLFGCSNRPPGLRRAPPGTPRGSSGAFRKGSKKRPRGPLEGPGPPQGRLDGPGTLQGPSGALPGPPASKACHWDFLGARRSDFGKGRGGHLVFFLNVYKIHLLYVVQGNPPRQDRSCVALN